MGVDRSFGATRKELLPCAIGLQLRERLVLDGDSVALAELHLYLLVFVQGHQEGTRRQHLRELAVLQLPGPAK